MANVSTSPEITHGHEPEEHHSHEHHEQGFFDKWIFSQDHKMIGK